MKRTFVQGVLSTPKRRQSYFYFRNLIAGGCGIAVYVKTSTLLGMYMAGGIGFIAAVAAFFTIAPVIAFLICLFEQMAS